MFDKRIQELNLILPPAPKPIALYQIALQHGNMLYLSGHGPLNTDKTLTTGKVGAELDLEQGTLAARQVGLTVLATLREKLGTLDNIVRLVKTLALVNCTPDFTEQPKVVNGFSELMRDVFGEMGVGVRSAVGTNSLPGNMSVEIECLFEVK